MNLWLLALSTSASVVSMPGGKPGLCAKTAEISER
jgi:hypothetical protein